MKSRLIVLWVIWSLFGAVLVSGVSIYETEGELTAIIANTISLAPLLGLLLALGSTRAAGEFNAWLRTGKHPFWYVGGVLTLAYGLPGIVTGFFNPYNTIIFGVFVFTTFGVLKGIAAESYKLEWTDTALWILLWIPFDLRWFMKMNGAEEGMSYAWWSTAISLIAVIGWFGYRRADIGYRLVPNTKDLKVALIALFGITLLVVPPGLLTGFLTFSPPDSFDIPSRTLHFIGLFITVALPEELFFRGILLRGLDGIFARKWIPMAVSSLAFGLMHWNNAGSLTMQITYVLLAAIAGAGYGWAYRKSGNNLLAAILTHTLVDWVWKLLFAG